jgi:hypothetical protein
MAAMTPTTTRLMVTKIMIMMMTVTTRKIMLYLPYTFLYSLSRVSLFFSLLPPLLYGQRDMGVC